MHGHSESVGADMGAHAEIVRRRVGANEGSVSDTCVSEKNHRILIFPSQF